MQTIQIVLSNPLFLPIVMTLVIIFGFPLLAGYMVLIERKVLADLQVRLGPMRVGPHGLLQPLADALKLLLKEDIIPTDADKAIFWFAPIISTFTALSAFLHAKRISAFRSLATSRKPLTVFASISGLNGCASTGSA